MYAFRRGVVLCLFAVALAFAVFCGAVFPVRSASAGGGSICRSTPTVEAAATVEIATPNVVRRSNDERG